MVTKIYTTNTARPDTCTSVVLLTIRVREPDTKNWKKLDHLMNYLRKTRNLSLILWSGGAGILKWWIDITFTVHPNMRRHTGGGLSMVRGFPVGTSTKKKINTQSSIES